MDYTITQKTDINIRKSVGRSQLSNNNLAEALDTYRSIILDYPNDTESYLVLGDLYLAGDMAAGALILYERARQVAPENTEISSRISLAEAESTPTKLKFDPLSATSLNVLCQALTGRARGVQEVEIEKATRLLEQIIQSANPAELVSQNLDQIESMLPALLEMNIRQARQEQKQELVEGLETLQDAIQGNGGAGANGDAQLDFSSLRELAPQITFERIGILIPDPEEISPRVQVMLESLKALGYRVELLSGDFESHGSELNLIIASNPQVNPWMLEKMAAYTAARIPIIVDLETDFEQMPLNHPDYLKKGLGMPANARAYTASMLLANIMTTPNLQFAEQLAQTGYRSLPVPDGWSRSNPLWEKNAARRNNSINIGWIGGSGMLEDILEIRRILIRVVREFPRTQLVIAEDSKAFQLFESLPENRKLFLPEVSQDDYPYLLGQLDILTVPLRNVPFNYSVSDAMLVQAGIKHVPWVASRMPATTAWNSGGLLASTPEEWHTNLRQLVMDEDMRRKLGDAGYLKAQERESQQLKYSWSNVLREIARDPISRGFLTRNQTKSNLEQQL